jgi:hypothetical protein
MNISFLIDRLYKKFCSEFTLIENFKPFFGVWNLIDVLPLHDTCISSINNPPSFS